MGDGVFREGGVDTTNGRIDHLELYNLVRRCARSMDM